MSKFAVLITRSDTLRVVVEAENRDEAMDAAYGLVMDAPFQDQFLHATDEISPYRAVRVADETPIAEPKEKIVCTARERDTILAALRMWQAWMDGAVDLMSADRKVFLLDIAENGREGDDCSLNINEVDALCERINCGG